MSSLTPDATLLKPGPVVNTLSHCICLAFQFLFSGKVIFLRLSPVVWDFYSDSLLYLNPFCPFPTISVLCGFVLYFSIVMLEHLIKIA